jgi:two-component system, NarL family, invasion response regulator UvrY
VIRILIADDHAVVRRGLRQILSESFPRALFGEVASAQELLSKIQEQKWSLLTLDIGLPDRSGLDLLRDLRQSYPRLPVLILSVHPESQYARRVLKAGAAGYLSKDTIPFELAEAARKVLKGGRYVSPALAEQLATDLTMEGKKTPYDTLSDRELEVLRMIGLGKTITQIAEALFLSPKTVSIYRARILEKTDMTTTGQLIRYAVENYLID